MSDEISTDKKRRAGERAAVDHLIMIKGHIVSLRRFLSGADDLFSPMSIVGLRQAYGDIRMVIEEIMLMSVSAHKDAGEAVSKRLRSEYQAVNKMRLLRELNPRFFPMAIEIKPSDEPGIDGRFVPIKEGCLTEEDVRTYYTRCGDGLHANSKLTSAAEYREDVIKVREFVRLVSRLLETFEVDISGQGYFVLGHLNLDDPGLPRLFMARPATNDIPEARPTGS